MTNLTFLLQTSSGVPVMGLARADEVLFDSSLDDALNGSREYRLVLEAGLAHIGAQLTDITELYVDIGPGGLGVTRTGVAFANALGFALGLPTTGLPAFDLLGAQASQTVNCAQSDIVILRKAAKPYVHFGIFQQDQLTHYEHCKLQDAETTIDALDDPIFIGNVTVNEANPPVGNAASLKVMLHCARRPESAKIGETGARAYPIVDEVR